MRTADFGWDYPPGAEQDPDAPWNDGERPPSRDEIRRHREQEREDERDCGDDW